MNSADMTSVSEFHLVVVSTAIAVVVSSISSRLATQLRTLEKPTRSGWLLGGAIAISIGIGLMYYTDMVVRLPPLISYGVPTILLSTWLSALLTILMSNQDRELPALIQKMNAGVLVVNPQAEILTVNQSALNLLNHAELELLGKIYDTCDWQVIQEDGTPFPVEKHPVMQVLSSLTSPQEASTNLPAQSPQTQFPHNWLHRPPQSITNPVSNSVSNVVMGVFHPTSQDHKWLLVNAEPQFTKDGDLKEIVCSFTDITSRKHAEENVQKAAACYLAAAQRETLVNHLATQIRNSLDLNTILAIAVNEIQALMQIDRCHFFWYRPDLEYPRFDLVHEAHNPNLCSLWGNYSIRDCTLLLEKTSKLEILRTDNLVSDPNLDPGTQAFFTSLGFTSLLLLPIQTRSNQVGVLACGRCQLSHLWQDDDVELLKLVTNQLGIAIQQAELYYKARFAAVTAQEQALQLEQALQDLQQTQTHLIQTEKLSSLGQLVASVAHEINNPVSFLHGNLAHANLYAKDLLSLVQLYQQRYPEPGDEIEAKAEEMELDFVIDDMPKILSSMKLAADRIREIVLSLRNFSRTDDSEKKFVDIHDGIDTTLLILQNRLKPSGKCPPIQILKEYGELPLVNCYAGQLNQVFMNLISNAIDALEQYNTQRSTQEIEHHPSIISLQTEVAHHCPINSSLQNQGEQDPANVVVIRIADNGPGMTEEVQRQLFNPFFTTKGVDKGTGLGLSISRQIVVEKHGGELKCTSVLGQGTEFLIEIPIFSPAPVPAELEAKLQKTV